MANYETGNNTFVNPYNFISLDENCSKGIDYKTQKLKGKLTGWLVCSLETKTPIFIPNTTKVFEDNNKIRSMDFFSYKNLAGISANNLNEIKKPKPVIPGSEIRGTIRSAYEAVTNSCLSTIDDNKALYKRVQSPAKSGQLVFQQNKWQIIECNRCRLPKHWVDIDDNQININGDNYQEGQEVFVSINYDSYKINEIYKNQKRGLKKGYLHIGEYNENKNYESVFLHKFDRRSGKIRIKDIDQKLIPEILNGLIINILMYRSKINQTPEHGKYLHVDYGKMRTISDIVNEFKNNKNEINLFNKKLKEKYPDVFNYLNGALINFVHHYTSGRFYLSPAAIGREVFFNQLNEIIHSYEPCNRVNNLCNSCALFGLAGEKDAACSRIRFTDAISLENYDYLDSITLKELSSPKLSATEFYLFKPDNAHLWNYDYAVNWNSNRYGIPGYSPQIRGRKFYWHQKFTEEQRPYPWENQSEATERNVHVRPLKYGKFKFKVYFNNITDEELNQLLWTLELGGKGSHAHKIGMGKSIGLGSIQIKVDKIKKRVLHIVDKEVIYDFEEIDKPEYSDVEAQLREKTDAIDEFLKITNYDDAPNNISYPYNDGDEKKTYEWFVANKRAEQGTGTSPVINKTLPKITDDNVGLPTYREC
ncbi:MAG: TIGR03986 family CRISPR-associated RAMP protein [Candidatus Lokiarchaeota archaeon]|nr:TIGR03986 family CRISPR-associated RAMP protein [Candidatus Lokiarchaeota archaeon]